VCAPGQRFEVFNVEVPTTALVVPQGLWVRQAASFRFGATRFPFAGRW
jgi:hypothetical protein